MLPQHIPRRLAIVTGASRRRGIGAAVCRALAQAGIDIFFTHWSPYDRRMPWGAEEDEPAHVLTLAINNRQVEGQVTRIKLIKRMMYGKAGFALLRQRVLHRI